MCMNVLPDIVIAKFWKHVEKTDYCWNWTGAMGSGIPKLKYGLDGRIRMSARKASLLISGKEITGKTIQPYVCKNALCVNPEHLGCFRTSARLWYKHVDTCADCGSKLTRYKSDRAECLPCKNKRDRAKRKDPKFNKRRRQRYKKWRDNNIVEVRKYYRDNHKKRMLTDPIYAVRCKVGAQVRDFLKRKGTSKKGKATWDFLPYTPQELKQHLEKQFEPWMTWANRGHYSPKTWNDNDSSTWTWQMDHIIPQSKLPYTSLQDPNFAKCWALENLRPLSAKQNVIENNRR